MSLKEATLEVIKKLPDDASAEDIMEKVDFVNQVLEGLTDSEAGRTITTEELQETACSRLIRNLTPSQWIFFFQEEEYRLICPNLP